MDIRVIASEYLSGKALETFILWYKIYRKDLLEVGFNSSIPDVDVKNIQTSISKFIIENGGRLIMGNNELEFSLLVIKPKKESWLHLVRIFNEKFNKHK